MLDNLDSATWLAVSAGFAFVASVAITYFTIQVARRYSLHAHPNERSSHTVPTPQLGGFGIAVPVYFAIVAHEDNGNLAFSALLVPAILYFLLGLYDDLRPFTPQAKLVGQIAVALSAFIGAGLYGGGLAFDLFFGSLWTVWIVGFTNAFNFMDGMNGKAGTFAAIALVAIALITSMTGEIRLTPAWTKPDVYALTSVAVASIAGFLVFNCRTNAAIFLGDCGSHFLGYLLSAIVLLGLESIAGPGRSLLVYVILFMPFLFDVALTLVRRTLARKRIWEAHREHLYQRLLVAGMGHMAVLRICLVTYLVCAGFAIACAISATWYARATWFAASVVVMAIYAAFVRSKELMLKTPEAAK